MRMHGHGAHDDMSYVPQEMFAGMGAARPDRPSTPSGSSPTTASRRKRSTRSAQRSRAYVEECAERALASPMPDPELATEGVFADGWEPLGDGHAPWSRWSQGNGTRRAA